MKNYSRWVFYKESIHTDWIFVAIAHCSFHQSWMVQWLSVQVDWLFSLHTVWFSSMFIVCGFNHSLFIIARTLNVCLFLQSNYSITHRISHVAWIYDIKTFSITHVMEMEFIRFLSFFKRPMKWKSEKQIFHIDFMLFRRANTMYVLDNHIRRENTDWKGGANFRYRFHSFFKSIEREKQNQKVDAWWSLLFQNTFHL